MYITCGGRKTRKRRDEKGFEDADPWDRQRFSPARRPPPAARRPPPAARRLAGTLHPADGSRTGEAQRRRRHAVRRRRHASRRVIVRWRWRGINDLGSSAGLNLLDENPQCPLLRPRAIDPDRRFADQVFEDESNRPPVAAPSRGYDVLGNGVQVGICRGAAQRGDCGLLPVSGGATRGIVSAAREITTMSIATWLWWVGTL